MKKRIKKYNLNTSNPAHSKLMLKGLYTDLLLRGKVSTTSTKAKALKSYAQQRTYAYSKITDPILKDKWVSQNITSLKFRDKILERLDKIASSFKVTSYKERNRDGDNALVCAVEIIN